MMLKKASYLNIFPKYKKGCNNIMNLFTILLFFVYSWGFGYSITRFFKQNENVLEKHIMNLGIGLASIPFFGVLINIIRIPLDWRIILVLSLILPLYDLFTGKFSFPKKFKLKKSDLFIIFALIIFLASLYIYASGAFKYPWLEDDDPWNHASGIKYVSLEKNVFPQNEVFMYLSPYPPGYDMLFGILHQTSSSLYWTLKFFNALIVSLSILFFYFFAKKFLDSREKALFATFILASLPSFLSHFIWAHSLVILQFIVSLYCLEMLSEDKNWMYATMLVIAGACLTQPTQPIKFAFMYTIYFAVKWISSKKFNLNLALSIVGGYFLSLIWYFNHWKGVFLQSSGGSALSQTSNAGFFSKMFTLLQKAFPPNSGSATRPYTFNDIVFTQTQNMINNPIGIGIVISILLAVSALFVVFRYKKLLDKNNNYLLIILLWSLFAFLGFNTMTFNLPFGLYSFRFWMLFAIPASLLAAEGTWWLLANSKKFNVPKIALLTVIIVGILFTSSYQKYAVNTAGWGFGIGWTSQDELQGYYWLQQNLPADTKVFTFTDNMFVMGYDMYSCVWCSGVIDYQKIAFNDSISNLHSWLKNNGYQYIIIGGRDVKKFGLNETNDKLQEVASSTQYFKSVYTTKAAFVFQVE